MVTAVSRDFNYSVKSFVLHNLKLPLIYMYHSELHSLSKESGQVLVTLLNIIPFTGDLPRS